MVLKIAIIVVLLCFNISHGAQSLSLPHAKNPRIQKSGITSGFHALISHRQGQLTEPSPIKSASFGDANLRPKKPALGSFSDIFGLGKQSSEKIQPKHRQPRKFDHSHRIGAASTIQNTNVQPDPLFVSSGDIVWPKEKPPSPGLKLSPYSGGRQGAHTFWRANVNAIHDDTLEVADLSVLDVHHPQSPYGLIQDVLPQSPYPPRNYPGTAADVAEGLNPQDVWLSDGDLLVLKGGTTSTQEGFDNPWEPLDDYQAPYREPVLAPENILETHKGQFSGIAMFLPSVQEPTHLNHYGDSRHKHGEEIIERSPRLGGFHHTGQTRSHNGGLPLLSVPSSSSNNVVFPIVQTSVGSSQRSTITSRSPVEYNSGWIPSSPSFNAFLRTSSFPPGTLSSPGESHKPNSQPWRHHPADATTPSQLISADSYSSLGLSGTSARTDTTILRQERDDGTYISRPPLTSHRTKSILYQNIPSVKTATNQEKPSSDGNQKIKSLRHSLRSAKVSISGTQDFYPSLLSFRSLMNLKAHEPSNTPLFVSRPLSALPSNSSFTSTHTTVQASPVKRNLPPQARSVSQPINRPIQSLNWSPGSFSNIQNRARYIHPIGLQLQGIQFLQQRPLKRSSGVSQEPLNFSGLGG